MASFFSDDPNCGNDLEVLTEKLPSQFFNMVLSGLELLARIPARVEPERQRSELKAAAEAMQQSAREPFAQRQNPAWGPATFIGRPNRTPPPRRRRLPPIFG